MKALCFFALLLVTAVAHAQDCGGMANAGGTCVPPDVAMPGYQRRPNAPQLLPPVWVDQYGAIATDANKGIVGASTHAASRPQSKELALADCREKGGTQCKIQLSYGNECAAMVIGDNGKIFNTNAAKTVEAAIRKGIQMCAPAAHICRAYYTACSLPLRIQ